MTVITCGKMNGIVTHLFVKHFTTLFEKNVILKYNRNYDINVITIIRGLRMELIFYDKMKEIVMSLDTNKQFEQTFNEVADYEGYDIDFNDMMKFICDDWFTNNDNKIFLEYEENEDEETSEGDSE